MLGLVLAHLLPMAARVECAAGAAPAAVLASAERACGCGGGASGGCPCCAAEAEPAAAVDLACHPAAEACPCARPAEPKSAVFTVVAPVVFVPTGATRAWPMGPRMDGVRAFGSLRTQSRPEGVRWQAVLGRWTT